MVNATVVTCPRCNKELLLTVLQIEVICPHCSHSLILLVTAIHNTKKCNVDGLPEIKSFENLLLEWPRS